MAEKHQFTKGDKVEWNSAEGTVEGEIVEKVTSTENVKGHTAKASEDEPQYKVKSDKTGKEAIHRPESIKPQ